jgi:hypothetical protein
VIQSQDFNFTGGEENKSDMPANKVDEDAPVNFQLDKPVK